MRMRGMGMGMGMGMGRLGLRRWRVGLRRGCEMEVVVCVFVFVSG
jgi:hypothetical protein